MQHSEQQTAQLNSSGCGDGSGSSAGASAKVSSSLRRLQYARMCAMALHGLQQRKLIMHFVQMLPANRQRTFLINRGMLAELAAQVEKQRSWMEAAAVCEEAGDLLKAAQLHQAHGQTLPASQLLLRQVRLLLLWPESLGLPAAAAKQQAVQLLMRSAQLQASADSSAEADPAVRELEAEAAVLGGLAQGFAGMQQVQAWMAAYSTAADAPAAAASAGEGLLSACTAAAKAKTRLLVTVEGFSYALRLTLSSSSSSSSQNCNAAATLQLVQQWQQLLSVLLPALGALDAALRLSDAPSPEQQQLLAASEFYMCVRPSGTAAEPRLRLQRSQICCGA
ncbi:hypothetical protein COO60DRAFT_91696 [Scenedesmus sp. NREL 46B-D3]|nr:hypothetical protein COO60DRAFT_91696 [Scenedesmus sp. NREL 46B-D3]